MDYSGEWGVRFQEETDWLSTDWTSSTVSLVSHTLERYINGTDSNDILPSFGELYIDEPMSAATAAYFQNSLPKPAQCIALFDRYDVLKQALQDNTGCYHQLVWLYKHWKKDYFIFINS